MEGAVELDPPSLLMQQKLPVQSFATFQETMHVFESSPEQVRQLLSYECSIIFECNVCRNLFRCLATFVSHKLLFCNTSSSGDKISNEFLDQSSLLGNQMSEMSPSATMVDNQGGENSLKAATNSRLHSVIERLKRDKEDGSAQSMDDAAEPVLHLERVPATNNAVYQTLVRDEADSIKTEIEEVNDMLTNATMSTVVGPDGQAIIRNMCSNENNQNAPEVAKKLSANICCKICKSTFQTKKTLKIHIQRRHCSSTYVFQCPSCSRPFLRPSTVIRHLANVHNKPPRRIRVMRKNILKRQVRLGDVKVKKPLREVKLLLNQSGANQHRITKCQKCGKVFARLAALSTHLLNCRVNRLKNSLAIKMRKAAVARVVAPKPPSRMKVEDKPVKVVKAGKAVKLATVQQRSIEKVKQEHAQPEVAPKKPSPSTQQQSVANAKAATSAEPHVHVPQRVHEKQLCRCKRCHKQFDAICNLRRHISMYHYRDKNFGCKLCDFRAFRRCDVLNHLTVEHNMSGERDKMSAEYVFANRLRSAKADVDSDILIIQEEGGSKPLIAQSPSTPNRSKRSIVVAHLSTSSSDDNLQDTPIPTPTKLRRTRKKHSATSSGADKDNAKRPIRNRVKAVNKDFVYDLSALSGHANTEKETLRRAKLRANSLNAAIAADELQLHLDLEAELLIMPPTPLIAGVDKMHIVGIAQRITGARVQQSLAASSTLPELPTERPQMRPRHVSTLYRTDAQDVPVFETTQLDAARLEATCLMDDGFLKNISRGAVDGFKLKPYVPREHSALNSLLEKVVDSTLHKMCAPTKTEQHNKLKALNGAEATGVLTSPITPTRGNVKLLANGYGENAGAYFVDPEPSIPKSSSPPPTPRKRMRMFERFIESAPKDIDYVIRAQLEK